MGTWKYSLVAILIIYLAGDISEDIYSFHFNMAGSVSVLSDNFPCRNGRVVVLINNYNYGRFLRECLKSVLNQEYKPDFVIFVDDGSTDDSVEIVNDFAFNHPELEVISKKNGGQLSSFNAAAGLIYEDDYVFFLDSDDIWPSDYISNVVNSWNAATDMVLVECDRFRDCIDEKLDSCVISNQEPVFIPLSSAVTRRTHCWIGSPTSAVSVTGRLFNMVFPYLDESNWRTRADDVIVFSSSIMGASKLYVPSLAISYRIHGGNNFYGNAAAKKDPSRPAAIDQLFREICDRACVSRNSGLLETLREIRCLPDELFGRFCIPDRRKLINGFFVRLFGYGGRIVRKLFSWQL